jgi:hypothetical protein
VPGDLNKVVGLVREAADWLGSKGIDQWQEPNGVTADVPLMVALPSTM